MMNRFNRPHSEIAEWYWLTEYLNYSNKTFPTITIQLISVWMRHHE